MSETEYQTIPEMLRAVAANSPNTTALFAPKSGMTLTYGDLPAQVDALATALSHAAPDPQRRPRIGVVLPNGLSMAVLLLASAAAGEATPFNPGFTTAEFERYFTATRIDMLVLRHDETGPAARAATALGLPILRLAEDLTLQGLSAEISDAASAQVAAPTPDDIALVLMTSGSTGLPKIVPLSHRNVTTSACDVVRSLDLQPQDRCLAMWQQFHIGGLVDLLLAPLAARSTVILTEGFDAAAFFDLRAEHKPTWFQGVPTTLGELLRYGEHHQMPKGPGGLRLIRSVAAALTPDLQTRLEAFFDVPIVRTLGMTEAGPLITSTALPPAQDKLGSVGRACGPELVILDADGQETAQGQTGDIAVRGPNVFAGYENNSDANAAAFQGPWFLTGDRGYLDPDGDLFLTGRTKEQINRGGYKIMPGEVEAALASHPAIAEAAVFGLAHPTLGEDVAAALVLRADKMLETSALRDHLKPLLAPHKMPAQVLFYEALPRNPVGKVDRLALAMKASAESDAQAMLQAPRSPEEQCIADIWKRELDLPEIGIRQDFVSAGGDSLSALRVVVALEAAFERPMPESVFETLTTIEDLAALLTREGLTLSPPALAQVVDAAPKSEKHRAEKMMEVGEDDVAPTLSNVTSKAELDLALRQMVVYRTPAQVTHLLERIDARNTIAVREASFLQRLRLHRRFTRKRSETLAEIAPFAPDALRWARQAVTEAATLYAAPDQPAWDKTLIIGFSGNGQGMSSEMYRFLLPLDPSKFDFLLLRDTARFELYLEGLPEMGDTLMALGGWLEDFAQTEGYAARMALGTSGGGLAALFTGLHFGWDRAIAMSPPRLSKHTGYAAFFDELQSLTTTEQQRARVAHGAVTADTDAARQIRAYLPEAAYDLYSECPKHNLLNYMRETGMLPALYQRWFEDETAHQAPSPASSHA